MRQALAFLTPFPGARTPTPGSLRWFPVVGLLLGFVLGALWWGADHLWSRTVAALIVVVADLALTGMLHVDGLADAADGLLPHLTQARRLEVMQEPTVGAFGVAAVVAVLLGRWVLLTALRPAPLLLAALWCTSRSSMAAVVDRAPYARSGGGLVSAFSGARVPILVVGAAGATSLALSAGWAVPAGPVAVIGAAAGFGAIMVLGMRRIGGFTGDVLGAAGLIGETVGLLVAAARW